MIYTFYSYKGGVGRSMALANIAEIFYQRGLTVLMVDFDLEAPGLERFFDVKEKSIPPAEVLTRRGVIDMLSSYQDLYTLSRLTPTTATTGRSNPATFPYPIEPLTNFMVPIYKEKSSTGGTLYLIPAGRRSGDEFRYYAERLHSFDWDDFYNLYDGERFFEWFRKEAEGIANVVLIDSRTGLTEMSGVCTYQLADVVVMFVAPNQQNLAGVKMLAESLKDPKTLQEVRKGRELSLLFVPSRVENSESQLLQDFANRFQREFGHLIAPQLKDFFRTSPFLDLKIPYIPYYAYLENAAVREPERPVAADLITPYTKIASTLIELAPKSSPLYRNYYAPQTSPVSSQTAGLSVERTKDFTGRQWVLQRINAWLEAREPRVLLITGEPGSGKTALALQLVAMNDQRAEATGYSRLGAGYLTCAYFCQREDDPQRFITALALKLAERYQPFAQALAQAQTSHPEITIEVQQRIGTRERGAQVIGVTIQSLQIKASPRVAFEALVVRPLQQLYVAGFGETMVILVDELDAALTYRGEDNIVTLLSDSIPALPLPVRFLLSSRRDPRVLRAIQGESLDLIHDAPESINDVRDYAYHRLEALPEPYRKDRGALSEQIARAAKGNFLYAHSLLDVVLHDVERVKDISGMALPGNLADIYRQSLKHQVGTNLERWGERYRPVLGVLAVAFDGVTGMQLAGITRRPLSEVADTLQILSQYLDGPQPDGPFRLFHHSFCQFLLSDPEYQVYPAEAHLAIANYFLRKYNRKWLNCDDDYALRYTPSHLMEAMQDQARVEQRTSRRLLVSLSALLMSYDFLEATGTRHGVDALLHDARRAHDLDTATPAYEGLVAALEMVADKTRGVDLRQHLSVFTQQVYAAAVAKGLPELAKAAERRLMQCGQPYLSVLWQARESAHHDTVRALWISPDNRILLSISADQATFIWDLNRGEKRYTVTEPKASGSTLWSRLRGALIARTHGAVNVVAFAQNTSVYVTTYAGRAPTVSRVELKQQGGILSGFNKKISYLPGLKSSAKALSVTPDGKRAIAGSKNKMVKVWNLEKSSELVTLTGHTGAITAVAVTSSGRRAISGSQDKTIKVWELPHGKALRTLTGHTGLVTALAVTRSGRRLISGSEDKTIKIWSLVTGKALRTLTGHTGTITALAVMPDGKRVVSISSDCFLKVWDVDSGKEIVTFSVESALTACAVAPNSVTIAVGEASGLITVLHLQEADAE